MAAKQERARDPRDIAWCYLYIKTGNATASAREAYKTRTEFNAKKIGHRNLKNNSIKKLLVELQEKIIGKEDDVINDAKDVLVELKRGAYYDPKDYFNVSDKGYITVKSLNELTEDQRKAIDAIEFDQNSVGDAVLNSKLKVKFRSKEKNLELLGKNLKMFTDIIQGVLVTKPEVYMPDNGRNKPVNE